MNNSIKQLREQMGLSQADLGSSVDVSRQTINSIENGKFDPSLPLAFKSWVNFLTLLLNKFFQQITLINRINYGKS
ncbi:MAG: hypothetical protein Ct9H90mP6_04300 [Gammaproteobacteria bacterium]|nr:MAG: hypothetical protein Ct9H90mP6_04300 [Gammaproteobacteria bacterium]